MKKASLALAALLLAATVPAVPRLRSAPQGVANAPTSWQLFWIDRTGKKSGPIGSPIRTGLLRLSPDGKRVALYERVPDGLADIWVYDLERNTRTRLTTDPANEDMPVWSPDGSRLIFDSHRGSKAREYSLYEQPSNGSTPERLLLQNEPGTTMFSRDWSSDGRWLIFSKRKTESNSARDLWVLPLTGDRKPFPYLVDRFSKGQAALSPNSRWLVHTTNESGMRQVVVRPFPDPSGGKWQISTTEGAYPRWRRDGRELFYLDPNGSMMAVSVTADSNFQIGKTTPLFKTSIPFPEDPSGASYPYDVAPGGQRFLIAEPLDGTNAGVSCESLASVSLPHTAIASARMVAAGTFAAPDQQLNNLPEFCRVTANSRPTNDSDIQLEIWLPVGTWNGKFQVGSMGAGIPAGLRFAGLAAALRDGYATGGVSAYRSVAELTNRPERITDWAYRAAHELAVTGKSLATAFYGKAPKLSVIDECGGASIPALNTPPRYPEDYDAVAVGGYSTDRTHMIFGMLWPWVAAHRTEGSAIPPAKLALLHNAALQACDLSDGVRDGVIDPPRCNFDPKVLLCPAGDGPNCLTSAQVRTAQEIYTGPVNPRTGQRIYSPLRPGSELGWAQIMGLERTRFSGPEGFRIEAYEIFRHLVFKNPNWTYKNRPVDFDADVSLADSKENRLLDGLRNTELADLKKFVERGGKLLLHSGWADPNVPPGGAIEYYNKVVARLGEKQAGNAVRLFMVPGMGHCPGTTGEDNFDFDGRGIVEKWREEGQAPDRLIATRYKNGVETGKRLVCPYPQLSIYRGSGSTDDPANFLCRKP